MVLGLLIAYPKALDICSSSGSMCGGLYLNGGDIIIKCALSYTVIFYQDKLENFCLSLSSYELFKWDVNG